MTEYLDLAALSAPRLPEEDVEIELKKPDGTTVKGKVRVRGMSRTEALGVQMARHNDQLAEEIERRMLAMCMINPPMTKSQAGDWMDASPGGELEPITDKIAVLSGMRKESAKEAVIEFERDPEAEFRVSAGEGSGDDGGGPSGADVEP